MFTRRDLSPALATVRGRHAPDALVLNAERDFETLPSDTAEDLALLTDRLDPASYPASWVPADAPDALQRYASTDLTIGAPGDGGVTWTRQTEPPVVIAKPRLTGSPEPFVEFLVAEALVDVGQAYPEQFLPFFGERYRNLATATRDHLDPAGTYQLAVALYDAYRGLHGREVFPDWTDDLPSLYDAWVEAGECLEPRLAALSGELATGETAFGDAAELACSAVKHDIEPPSPFGALDAPAYREHGAAFACSWAEKTFARLG